MKKKFSFVLLVNTKGTLKITTKLFKKTDSMENIIVGSYTGSNLTIELAKDCSVDLFNIDVEKIEIKLKKSGYFQGDTKIDHNMRTSNELRLEPSIDLTQLGQHILRKNNLQHLIIQPYKLIMYRKDDFVETLTDNEPNLVKTLIIHLPTSHVGGDFVFDGCNLSKYHINSALNYYIFDIDYPYKVLPVIDGVRVAIAFKCFKIVKLPGLVKCTKIDTLSQDLIKSFDFSEMANKFLYINSLLYSDLGITNKNFYLNKSKKMKK